MSFRTQRVLNASLSNSWQVGDSIVPPTLFKVTRDAYPTSQIGLLYD